MLLILSEALNSPGQLWLVNTRFWTKANMLSSILFNVLNIHWQ